MLDWPTGWCHALSVAIPAPATPVGIRAGGLAMVVVLIEGEYRAIGASCGACGAALEDATVCDDEIDCRCGGARYEVRTGALVDGSGPALPTYPVMQVDDDLYVYLDPAHDRT